MVNLDLNEKRIVLTRISLEQKLDSGLIISGEITSREEDSSAYGVIQASAEGNKYKVGTIVSFNPRITMKVLWKGKYYELLRENDVYFGVPEEEAKSLNIREFDSTEGKEEVYSNPGNFQMSREAKALQSANIHNPNAFFVTNNK